MKFAASRRWNYQTKEAVNTLCTNLSFAGGDIKRIMLTSCHPQEGKSFVSMQLMRGFSELGMRVVLVDADIRASKLQWAYDIQISGANSGNYPGLTRCLAGRASIDDVLGSTNIPGAWMILSGRTVNNSLPLFNTPAPEGHSGKALRPVRHRACRRAARGHHH